MQGRSETLADSCPGLTRVCLDHYGQLALLLYSVLPTEVLAPSTGASPEIRTREPYNIRSTESIHHSSAGVQTDIRLASDYSAWGVPHKPIRELKSSTTLPRYQGHSEGLSPRETDVRWSAAIISLRPHSTQFLPRLSRR
jgi:hypothetical protein